MSRKVLKQKVLQLKLEKSAADGREITNKEIAEAIGVNERTIGRWMNDKVESFDPAMLMRFMQYFDCPIERILQVETIEN